MLGGRAGLCWVGGRVYAGWEGGSMYAGWELLVPFLCGPISSRTHFFEGYGACSLCWVGVGVYVRAGVCACVRACMDTRAFLVRACVRACVRFMLNCVISVCVRACVHKNSVTRFHILFHAHVLFLFVCIRMLVVER